MPVEIAGFAQSFSRCLEFENVNPSTLEHVLAEVDEPLEMMFIEPLRRTTRHPVRCSVRLSPIRAEWHSSSLDIATL